MLKVFLRKVPFPLNSKNNRFFSLARVCVYASLESMRLLLFVLTKTAQEFSVTLNTEGEEQEKPGAEEKKNSLKKTLFFKFDIYLET